MLLCAESCLHCGLKDEPDKCCPHCQKEKLEPRREKLGQPPLCWALSVRVPSTHASEAVRSVTALPSQSTPVPPSLLTRLCRHFDATAERIKRVSCVKGRPL